jgi:hypothetical protein
MAETINLMVDQIKYPHKVPGSWNVVEGNCAATKYSQMLRRMTAERICVFQYFLGKSCLSSLRQLLGFLGERLTESLLMLYITGDLFPRKGGEG